MDTKKKTTLTPDDMQMMADLMQFMFSEQEKRIESRFDEQDRRIDSRFAEQEKRIESRFDEQDRRIDSRFAEQEKQFDKKYANKEEMKQLIRDTVSQVVEEKVIEKIGRLPTREEFFSRMDIIAHAQNKTEQELIILTHQHQQLEKRVLASSTLSP